MGRLGSTSSVVDCVCGHVVLKEITSIKMCFLAVVYPVGATKRFDWCGNTMGKVKLYFTG